MPLTLKPSDWTGRIEGHLLQRHVARPRGLTPRRSRDIHGEPHPSLYLDEHTHRFRLWLYRRWLRAGTGVYRHDAAPTHVGCHTLSRLTQNCDSSAMVSRQLGAILQVLRLRSLLKPDIPPPEAFTSRPFIPPPSLPTEALSQPMQTRLRRSSSPGVHSYIKSIDMTA